MIPDLNQPVENPKLKALLNKRATAPQEAQLDVVNEIAEEIAMNAHFLAVVNFGGSPVQNTLTVLHYSLRVLRCLFRA